MNVGKIFEQLEQIKQQESKFIRRSVELVENKTLKNNRNPQMPEKPSLEIIFKPRAKAWTLINSYKMQCVKGISDKVFFNLDCLKSSSRQLTQGQLNLIKCNGTFLVFTNGT